MKKIVVAIALGVLCVGCGEKIKQMKDAADAMQQTSKNVEKMQESADEATKFQQERAAKGDTVAMDFKELQKYLPSAPSGYKPEEEPSGSQQNMGGFSYSMADQKWVSTGGDTNNPSRVHVTITDLGGTQGAYGMMAATMMMAGSSEDAHARHAIAKMDSPYTMGIEDYNKDSKDAKFTAITRYRYMITVEATNQKDDQSGMVKDIASDVAKKFDGK